MKEDNGYIPYETTVDKPSDPSIFVTYQDDQALSEYLISFKQLPRKSFDW